MAKEKPSIPKGTRDIPPEVMRKRNYILNTIADVFKKYGFKQIETPSLENLSVLTGKYGDEGDQLLFKVLNSGDYLKDIEPEDIRKGSKELLTKISNKGLRYDLTVPLARFVVMNRNDITFPFKRYQIQPVWRADKPQRGRYREFLQCDADIVGTSSLLCEVEMIHMMAEVMQNLNFDDYNIRINHREILSSLAKSLGPADQENSFAVIIDKLDKIGWAKVVEELVKVGFDKSGINSLKEILTNQHPPADVQFKLNNLLDSKGIAAVNEVMQVLEMLGDTEQGGKNIRVEFDPSLARGLSYYTGIIFEVDVPGSDVGSVSGGGRYDDLTGIFGMPDIPATGFSFGIDRLYDVIDHLDKFPSSVIQNKNILIVHFDQKSFDYGLKVMGKLRSQEDLNKHGVVIELYPDLSKMNKQLTYANRNSISHVLIIGEEEMNSNQLTLKNMISGQQQAFDFEGLVHHLSNL